MFTRFFHVFVHIGANFRVSCKISGDIIFGFLNAGFDISGKPVFANAVNHTEVYRFCASAHGRGYLIFRNRKHKKQYRKANPDIEKDWDNEVGDRMVKLVFIGQKMNKEAIISALDDCLDK